MRGKNILFSAIIGAFLLFFGFAVSADSITDITLDYNMSDWEDVPYLIQEEAIINFSDAYAIGSTYYWNNDTDAWQTEAINGACMYNEATPLKLTGYKLANNADYIYFYWERNTDWMNYFWEIPNGSNSRDEQSFSADPVTLINPVAISEPPCMGELLYNPVDYNHDMVFSFDTNLDGNYDYYMAQNVIALQGAPSQAYSFTVTTYIYQDDGNGQYDSRDIETLVEELGDNFEQYPDGSNTCPYGVCQEGRISKSQFFDSMGLEWGDTVQMRYESYSNRLWRTAANLYTFNRHNNLNFKLSTPVNKKRIEKKNVKVNGSVKKGSRIIILVNNNREARFTTTTNKFSKIINLEKGWNYIIVKAKKGNDEVIRARKIKRL